MSIRIYAGGVQEYAPGKFRAWAAQYMSPSINFWPSLTNGRPASDWVITIGRATDWLAADLDPTITNLFGPELDGTEETKEDVILALSAKTLAEVGLQRRAVIQARLDVLGVPYTDFTGTTTMWQLFKRVLSVLFERDSNWGYGWQL